MTRTLPWKRNASSISAPKNAVTPPSKRPAAVDPHVSGSPTSHPPRPVTGDEEAQSTYPPYRVPVIKKRSQSSSPPPAPPEERFMISGVDGDDIWRMVEDEFLSVAGAFTAHLHRAEYKRLKRVAESQNAKTISTISRPVACDRTDTVKRRQDREELERRQGGAIKRMRASSDGKNSNESDDDDGPSPWAGTALQGLMDSPRKKAPRLISDVIKKTTITKPPMFRNAQRSTANQSGNLYRNTRPSSLEPHRTQGSSPRVRRGAVNDDEQTTQSEDDSDDDLDAAPTRLALDRKHAHSPADADSRRRSNASHTISFGDSGSANTRQRPANRESLGTPASPVSRPRVDQDDSDSSGGIFARARKRRERLRGQQRSEQAPGNPPTGRQAEKSKDTALDIVPSFI
ncbi:hypothetical protein MGG_05807 [Pyricularia oryzae 70-15]|uniref:Uncharacterized protein n=1 Tax=Pyricularia oryzae (strain 70-15 / ATCC MYA-4617 / FGSC 8958) TaxID=242507 RepID=G4N0I1_PYRO7|nr:uncharacterized protein MGG_05807 [Pyricularia oryzae 70-15]EHA52315.1 hypothetical protein MGG_05807 [Pyricularia oryzae 70-15]KAI7914160.1 hypothetical protein M9X92_009130 [Pyricularia oryzae]KAI7914791.1 hypothetical protein M0657_009308 [Pyricularia oryzae]